MSGPSQKIRVLLTSGALAAPLVRPRSIFFVYSNARAAASQIEKYNVSCTLTRETCAREGLYIKKIHSSRARLKREPSGTETHSRDKNAPRVSIGKVSHRRAEKMLSRPDCASFGTLLESIVWIKDGARTKICRELG